MSIRAETTFSLKDHLFNEASVAQLGAAIHAAAPAFSVQQLVDEAAREFPVLELKQRIHCLVVLLAKQLPRDFGEALAILAAALPPPLDATLTDDDFGEYIWVVPGEYAARHGCNATHLHAALTFLGEATKRFSSESALRPFLKNFPQATLAYVHQWSGDDNYHVRRLASEGIRPFLPWAQRVVLPPAEIIAVLDRLHADPTRYVTRSVANALNDISKIDAELALVTAKGWRDEERQHADELDWLIRHAMRTLVKADDPGALELLGYTLSPQFSVKGLSCSEVVEVGQDFNWQARLTSKRRQKLRVNLRLYFLKANGRHMAKVFAVSDADVEPGETLMLHKRVAFKPRTTRTLYPGTHYAELVVNGVTRRKQAFELVVPGVV